MTREHSVDEADELSGVASSCGRTPRGKKTRTRDGCLTCRKCRKACDKTKPSCLRCQRLSYACEWPEVKPYSQIGETGRKQQRSKTQPAEGQREDEELQSEEQPLTATSSYSFSASSSSVTSPAIPAYSQSADTSSTSQASHLPLPEHPLTTATSLVPHVPFQSYDRSLSTSEAVPVLAASVESPSRALDAQFWNEHSLYAMDYNFTDFSDIDSLLRLAGLAPMPEAESATDSAGAAGLPPGANTMPNASGRVLLPKDKIKAISTLFPPRVGAILDRMIDEQEDSNQVKLPLAYIVTMCLWAPSAAMKDLLQAAKNAYSGPDMQPMLRDLGEVAWSFIVNKPAKVTKIAIPPERIATMDISLPSKLFALMDMAIRQAIVEGAGAYYAVGDVMEKLLLQKYKPGHLFNVAQIGQTEHVHIYNFIFVDIMRAIQLGFPTTFAYYYAPEAGHRPDMAFSIGNSDAIICIMSEICALKFMLDRDVNSRSKGKLNPVYLPKAEEVLKKIESNPAIWVEPDTIDTIEGLDSIQHVSSIASQEAWRQAALIHYYSSIYRGSDAFEHATQAASRQILALFPVTQLGKPHRLFGMHGLPIFMAATVADTKEDRSACMSAFEKLSLGSAVDREVKAFFEHVWEESDKAGHRVDWLEYTSVETGPFFM